MTDCLSPLTLKQPNEKLALKTWSKSIASSRIYAGRNTNGSTRSGGCRQIKARKAGSELTTINSMSLKHPNLWVGVMERKSGVCFSIPHSGSLEGLKNSWHRNRNHYSSSERLPQVPHTTGLFNGIANSQSRSATALPPIAELKELSIDKVPPKMQSSPVVESPKVTNNTFPTSTSSFEAGIEDSADAFSSPRPPLTDDDFVTSNWKFKPGHQADIESFFHDIRLGEARKMGRPERQYKSSLWVKVPTQSPSNL